MLNFRFNFFLKLDFSDLYILMSQNTSHIKCDLIISWSFQPGDYFHLGGEVTS